MNIKTWQEKNKQYLDTKIVDPYTMCTWMQAEIDELRAEIERCTVGWNAANVDVLHHAMTITAQRKVLEQSLEALKYAGAGSYERSAAAITAIQEQLK